MITKNLRSIYSRKLVTVVLLTLLIAATITMSVSADTYLAPRYSDYVGTSDAFASTLSRVVIENPNLFACEITSQMEFNTVINVIGWTYFACTNKCRIGTVDTIIDTDSMGGYAPSGYKTTRTMFVTAGTCSGTTIVVAEGYHDFNDNYAKQKPWRPSSNYYKVFTR